MTDDLILNKVATIKGCIDGLIRTLPDELSSQVRVIHDLVSSVQTQLATATFHQQQAHADMVRLNSLVLQLHNSMGVAADIAQKLQLLSSLVEELDRSLGEAT